MKEQLLRNNYVVIDSFVSEEQAEFFSEKLGFMYKNSPQWFNKDLQRSNPQSTSALGIYDMLEFVELLVEKIPSVVSIVEEPVFPTYSYARMYKKDNVLRKHTDRKACEISVTLHLSNDGVEWPIYFETPGKETVAVNLKPGQAAVYLGCSAPHWRDTYEGTDYRQVFLHYVRARGGNRHCYFDKRK
jgi:hypothetical protein